MTFGEALKAVKQGKLITRDGWNGKNMFVYHQPGSKVALENLRCDAIRTWAFKNHGEPEIKIRGHLDMYTAQGDIQVGWLASQSDMLAEDWRTI